MRYYGLFSIFPLLAVVSSVAFAQVDTINEGFENVSGLAGKGWALRNNSSAPVQNWGQGNINIFDAQAGIPADYAAVGVDSVAGNAASETISNWLITPTLTLRQNSALTFWSRTVDFPFAPDRLEVRLSTNGASTNVGINATDSGDFVTTLLTINPNLSQTGYPNTWTQYTIPFTGLSGTITGRIAFRYFVPNGGIQGVNSDYIGIDTVRVAPIVVPELGDGILIWLGAGVSVLIRLRRRTYGVRRSTCPSKNPAVISPSP